MNKFPDNKGFFDFIVVGISIPLLLIIIVRNVNNKEDKDVNNPPPTTYKERVIVKALPETSTPNTVKGTTEAAKMNITTTPTEQKLCKKEIETINIIYPKEGETVSENPTCITIKHDSDDYCSVTWSYKINNSPWSESSSNSVCLYNMKAGPVTFELRAQSIISNNQTQLLRNFIYKPVPTITPISPIVL